MPGDGDSECEYFNCKLPNRSSLTVFGVHSGNLSRLCFSFLLLRPLRINSDEAIETFGGVGWTWRLAVSLIIYCTFNCFSVRMKDSLYWYVASRSFIHHSPLPHKHIRPSTQIGLLLLREKENKFWKNNPNTQPHVDLLSYTVCALIRVRNAPSITSAAVLLHNQFGYIEKYIETFYDDDAMWWLALVCIERYRNIRIEFIGEAKTRHGHDKWCPKSE